MHIIPSHILNYDMKMSNNTLATTGACLTLLFGIAIVFSKCSGELPGLSIGAPIKISKTKISFTSFFLKIKLLFIALHRLTYYPTCRKFNQILIERAKNMNESDSVTVKVKTFYFSRHGESVYNDLTINRNVFIIIFKTLRLILFETLLLFTNEVLTYDSPLSTEGISKSLNAAQFLSSPKNQNDPDIVLLNGKSTVPSVLITSYLRRAQGTVSLLFQSRLSTNDENIFITHELDEVVRNPDCIPMHSVFDYITFPLLEQLYTPQSYYRYLRLKSVEDDPHDIINPYYKILRFFDRVFHRFDEDVIIAVGHSRWIRYAMRIFFPPVISFSPNFFQNSVEFDILNKKLTNNGIIKVDVHLKKVFFNLYSSSESQWRPHVHV
uniref:Histidine phosphatase superfamily (Branch 1), putative n=1 Tax=Theileria annulata TaxID=5874 RepID=A0A3B0MQ45_THEAN